MSEYNELYYEDDDAEPPEPAFYSVAPYLIDKQYGGPEEGGWYYTAGYLAEGDGMPLPVIVRTWDEAIVARNKMDEELKPFNEGRRDISSVLSEGMYSAEINDGSLPKYFPETRPYYE